MKNQLIISLLTLVALAAVLFSLSCGETPQNTATRSNAGNYNNAPVDTVQSNQDIADVDCSGAPPDKQKKIKDEVEGKIKGNNKLGYQYVTDASTNSIKRFDIDVIDVKGIATLYIWGSIYINDKNDLHHLNKTYENIYKKGCADIVVFAAPPSPSPTPDQKALKPLLEFTTLCEDPNEICNGECRPRPCKKINGNTGNQTNSNSTNRDSNSNSNVNSNK